MAVENKTTRNKASVKDFLARVTPESKRRDSQTIARMMQEASGEKPAMWGPSIVGFGSYHYKYPTGREGDMPLIGFSPRKQSLTLYLSSRYPRYAELMARLGKHKTSKACLYIQSLEDVHLPTLKKLMSESVKAMRKRTA
jgi:hypothetical protein